MIYKNPDGTYSYTDPVKGSSDRVEPGGPAACPLDSVPEAYYHTHAAPDPDYQFEEYFNSDDRRYAGQYGIDGYLATPTGRFKRYDIMNPYPTKNLGLFPTR
jgi:hypothetical protein